MSSGFFRRPLAVAVAVGLSVPLLAAATPAVAFNEPAVRSDSGFGSSPLNHSNDADPGKPDALSPIPSAVAQHQAPNRQGTAQGRADEQVAVQKGLMHSSSGLRAMQAGDRAQAQRELEASLQILSKLPEAANPDGRRLKLIEEAAALRAALSAASSDVDALADDQEDEDDVEDTPDLVNPAEEPALESPENKPDSLMEPDPTRFDVPIVLNEQVKAYILFFQTRKWELVSRAIERAGQYLPMMREIFQEKGLPLDLVNLAYIESAFNYRAYSRAKASGIWQFIKATGQRYGLNVNNWVDERRDPQKATRAAAAYLKDLYGMFHSWPLALASYNAGEKRVQRAIQRQGTDDFWSLRLPRETQLFVPAFMAMTIIAKDPERYGFAPPIEKAWEVERAALPGGIDLVSIARAVDVPYEEIRILNAALKRGVTPVGYRGHEVYLPSGTKAVLLSQVDQLPRTRAREVVHVVHSQGGSRYRVKPGDSLGRIAARHRTTPALVARLNGMRVDDTLRVGVLLNLPQGKRSTEAPVALAAAGRSRKGVSVSPKPAGPIQSLVHIVKRGDTLWGIAKAYAVTPQELRRWNDLGSSARIKTGQSLRLAAHPSRPPTSADGGSKASARPVRYRVKQGDTLWEIARFHDVSPEELRRWNDLTHRAKLRVGQELTIHLERS